MKYFPDKFFSHLIRLVLISGIILVALLLLAKHGVFDFVQWVKQRVDVKQEIRVTRTLLSEVLTMRQIWIISSAYAFLCVVCSLLPWSMFHKLGDFAWLLGPPINLVWGIKYIWVFLPGTLLCAAFLFISQRAKFLRRRIFGMFCFLVSWFIFGFMVYAPSA